jgi:hypothetical protein
MDYLALRERSMRELARWKLPDPGVLPLHAGADFDRVRERRGAPSDLLRHLVARGGVVGAMWRIELADDLPADELCDREPCYERLAWDLDPSQGKTDVALRPLADLAAMLDFSYYSHRHARNAQYHGRMWDPVIAPGAVLERRRALEWLFQDVPREDVDLGA